MTSPYLASLAFRHVALVQRRDIANPAVIADIVVNALFIVVYTIFTVVCVKVIQRLPGRRTGFVMLCVASLFSVIHVSMTIAYRVSEHSSSGPFSRTDPLLAAIAFFNLRAVGYSLLYCALGLLLFDLHKSNLRGPLSKHDTIVLGVLFPLNNVFLASAMISVIFKTTEENLDKTLDDLTRGDRHDLHKLNVYYRVTLTTVVIIWVSTALYIAYVSRYVYRWSRRVGVQDKASRLMWIAIAPLNIIGMLLTIAATLIPFVLIPDFLVNGFFCAIIALLLSMGMRPEMWVRSPTKP